MNGLHLLLLSIFFVLSGPCEGNIHPGPGSPVEQKLEQLATQKVKAVCPSCKVTVQCKWIPEDVKKIPAQAIEGVQFSKPGIPNGYITADVLLNDRSSNAKVQLYVDVQQKVPVAKKIITRGSTVEKGDFVWQWKDLAHLSQQPVKSAHYFEGKTTVRLIRKGHIFFASDLAGKASISPGDHVTMLYKQNGITIRLDCIARGMQKKNRIRLYSKETGRTYMAKIINKHKTIWERTL